MCILLVYPGDHPDHMAKFLQSLKERVARKAERCWRDHRIDGAGKSSLRSQGNGSEVARTLARPSILRSRADFGFFQGVPPVPPSRRVLCSFIARHPFSTPHTFLQKRCQDHIEKLRPLFLLDCYSRFIDRFKCSRLQVLLQSKAERG
jgi:hypothetical protein